MISRRALHLVAVLLMSTAWARADITYNIDITGLTIDGLGNVNTPGSAIGDIVTDGALGSITAADIVDWNLTIDNGVFATLHLGGPLSGNNSFVIGTGVTATATNLSFDFSSGNEFFFERDAPAPAGFLCFGPSSGACSFPSIGGVTGISDGPACCVPEDERATALTGTHVFAQTAASVPEPSSLLLFGGVLIVVALERRSIGLAARPRSRLDSPSRSPSAG